MGFEELLVQKSSEIESVITSFLPAEEGEQKTIFEAANYSVLAGGKRLRPLFMKEVFTMFSGSGKVIEPFLAAIEFIHTSSLVHDDLPCMDNDILRRGRDTTWVKYGYDMAVLAGAGLMIHAFSVASKAFLYESDKAAAVGAAIGILADKTGIYGMIGGQTVDVLMTGKPLEADTLSFIYRLKTGALLEAAMMIGCILAGGNAAEVQTMEEIAAYVGMAFQIRDDILDITATTECLGKSAHSDEKNQKTTYVSLHGLEAAKLEVDRLSKLAVDKLNGLSKDSGFLEELIVLLTTREK